MYSDRREWTKTTPDKTPWTKTPWTIEREFVQGAFVRVFVLGLLKIGGGPRCVTYFFGVVPGCVIEGEGGQNWPKIAWRTLWTASKSSGDSRGDTTRRLRTAVSLFHKCLMPVNLCSLGDDVYPTVWFNGLSSGYFTLVTARSVTTIGAAGSRHQSPRPRTSS